MPCQRYTVNLKMLMFTRGLGQVSCSILTRRMIDEECHVSLDVLRASGHRLCVISMKMKIYYLDYFKVVWYSAHEFLYHWKQLLIFTKYCMHDSYQQSSRITKGKLKNIISGWPSRLSLLWGKPLRMFFIQ